MAAITDLTRELLIALNEQFLGDKTAVLKAVKARTPLVKDIAVDLLNSAKARNLKMITLVDENYPRADITNRYNGFPPFVLYEITPAFYDMNKVVAAYTLDGTPYTIEFPIVQISGRNKSIVAQTSECARAYPSDVLLEATMVKCSVEDIERIYIKKLISSSDYFVNLKDVVSTYSSKVVESILKYWTITKDHGPSICSVLESIEMELDAKGIWQGYRTEGGPK